MEIKQRFAPKGNSNRPGYAMKPEYITVHQTANTNVGANAEVHNRFVYNGGGTYGVSFHFAVDDKEAWQNIPLTENAWHAGDGGSGTGNRKSIGIEICENSDGDFNKAVANAAWLVRKLMKDYGIPITRVVPHKHWSGKNCPRRLLSTWDGFIAKVQEKEAGKVVSNPQPVVKGVTVYKIQKGDTLWGIAKETKGLSLNDLLAANPGLDPTKLQVGQVINLTRQPSPAPVVKPNVDLPNVVLRKGDRGDNVKKVQQALNDVYFKCGVADGIFGAKTEDAIKRFQSMYYDLKVDGIYGPNTRKKLLSKLGAK